MNESNFQNLSKLTRMLGADRLLDPKDVEQIRDILVAVLANNKKDLESLTEEAKTTIERLLDKIISEHEDSIEKVTKIAQEAKSDATEAVNSALKSFEEVKKLCQEVMDCKPENGKDADEEMIIEEVLAKIKLPEYKEVVLDDGTEIVAKINELPVSEDNQIDAKHIKNLPEFKNGKWSGITKGAVIKLLQSNLVAGTNITITDDGTGVLTIASSGGGGGTGITWNEVTGTSQTAAINNGYVSNNASLVTVALPTIAALGSIIEVAGNGAGGWKIAQPASVNINFGNQVTTTGTGGSLASVHRYDAVRLLCITANTGWSVLSSVGNITVV